MPQTAAIVDANVGTEAGRILSHPFWSLMRIAPKGNPYFKTVLEGPEDRQQRFIDAIVNGFHPISRSSPMVFGRVAAFAGDHGYADAKKLAGQIEEIENGDHAFVELFSGVNHAESYLRTVAAVTGRAVAADHLVERRYLDDLGIEQNGVGQVLGYCEMIESIAPLTTAWIGEFVAQWAVLTGKSFTELWWPYLCEHLMTEGGESEDQHIQIVDALIESMSDHCTQADRVAGCGRFADATIAHLDRVMAAAAPLS